MISLHGISVHGMHIPLLWVAKTALDFSAWGARSTIVGCHGDPKNVIGPLMNDLVWSWAIRFKLLVSDSENCLFSSGELHIIIMKE